MKKHMSIAQIIPHVQMHHVSTAPVAAPTAVPAVTNKVSKIETKKTKKQTEDN